MSFQQIENYILTEGTVHVPPELPLHFAMVSYYLLWNYRPRGVPAIAAGAEELRAVSLREC